jgi:hypothetical protein
MDAYAYQEGISFVLAKTFTAAASLRDLARLGGQRPPSVAGAQVSGSAVCDGAACSNRRQRRRCAKFCSKNAKSSVIPLRNNGFMPQRTLQADRCEAALHCRCGCAREAARRTPCRATVTLKPTSPLTSRARVLPTKGPLFRTIGRGTRLLTRTPLGGTPRPLTAWSICVHPARCSYYDNTSRR